MSKISRPRGDRALLLAHPCPECGQVEVHEYPDGGLYAVCPCARAGGVEWTADVLRRKLERSEAAAIMGRAGRGASKRRDVDYAALGRKGGAAGKGSLKPRR